MDNFLERVHWLMDRLPADQETPEFLVHINFGRTLACKVIDEMRDPSSNPDLLLRSIGTAGSGKDGHVVLKGFMREIQDALQERAP